jgi:hypothetical protein
MPIDLVKPVLDAIQSGQAAARVDAPVPPANGALGSAESHALGPGGTAPPAAQSPAAPDASPVEREK